MASASRVSENKPSASPAEPAPIVIDLGKQRRKAVKQLRRGGGALMEEIGAALDKLRASGTVAAGAQPVIVVVQQKKRRSLGFLSSL
jgi:uncharacterized protein DUF6200